MSSSQVVITIVPAASKRCDDSGHESSSDVHLGVFGVPLKAGYEADVNV